jgi:hypothetical protein
VDNDEYSLLRKTNIEQAKKIEVLEQTIKKMAEPAGPRHVSSDDLSCGRERVSPEDIATGKVVIDFPDPNAGKEPRQLKANEVHKSDAKKIAENLSRIASGELVVVD